MYMHGMTRLYCHCSKPTHTGGCKGGGDKKSRAAASTSHLQIWAFLSLSALTTDVVRALFQHYCDRLMIEQYIFLLQRTTCFVRQSTRPSRVYWHVRASLSTTSPACRSLTQKHRGIPALTAARIRTQKPTLSWAKRGEGIKHCDDHG